MTNPCMCLQGWCNVVGLVALTASTAQATLYNVVGIVQILAGAVLSPGYQVLILQGKSHSMALLYVHCYLSAKRLIMPDGQGLRVQLIQ